MKEELIKSTPITQVHRFFRIRFIVISFFLLWGGSLLSDELKWGVYNSSFDFYRSEGVLVETSHDGRQSIQLARLGYPLTYGQELESLYISFDEGSVMMKAGEVLQSQYKSKRFPDSINEVASFEQHNHQFMVAPADYLFLNRSDNTGDFSVYFRLRPYQLKRRMEIFQKAGLFEGQKQGFSAGWEKGRLFFEFYNFFWNRESSIREVRISTRDDISINQFHVILLLYRQSEGSLTLYLNGVEQERFFMTSDFTRSGTVLTPRFHRWDRSPLIIGKNYLGAIDDVIFSNTLLDPAVLSGKYEPVKRQGKRFQQKAGVVISRRIEFPTSRTGIRQIRFEDLERKGTSIRYYYRYSDRPFAEDADEYLLPFLRLASGKELREVKAKYLQWKAELYSDAVGEKTPEIKNLTIDYAPNLPPLPPLALELVRAGEKKVTLQFMRNLEMDVVNNGRYHIYYGLKPYEPLGAIKYKEFRKNKRGELVGVPITDADMRITDDLRYRNRIQVTINNKMIRDNLTYFKKIPGQLYEYPLLQRDIPFYFWVTTCDNEWSEALEHADHESGPSEYIVVRPN